MAFLDYSGLSRFLDKLKGYFVAGPASSTDAHVATFNGTTGKAIKDSGYTIAKSVPSDAKFSDTTYTFDGTYNSSTNKAATVSTVTNAIGALDGAITGTAGAGKTFTAFSQTDGKVTATIADISITKSQVSDFPTSMTPASHTHGNIQNGGALQTTDVAIANGDKLVVTDSSNSNKVARTSLAFDGSTATKCLTQKGTFESFTNNAGTITGITMNGASKGTSGVVDLGTVITAHQDISGKVSGPSSATNNAVAIFDGTGGKTIKNSGYTIGKSVPSDAVFTDTTALGSMTGTLSVDHGGTGKTSGADAANYFLNSLSTGDSDPQDNDYYISQYVNGGTTTITYHRRPVSKLWNYIKSKLGINTSSGSTGKCLTEKGTWASFTNNAGTITGIKMNGASKGTSGVVDLGTVITAHQTIPTGSTSTAGIVQLTDSVSSTSTTTAATPKNVKAAYDLANGKANKPTIASATAASGSWTSATPPTQDVSVTGVTANNTIVVSIASTATQAQYEAAAAGKLLCTAQGAGEITMTCYGMKPTENIPLTVLIVG